MKYTKQIAATILTGVLCISSTVAARAEVNGEQLGELQQQLQQQDEAIKQKEQERQAVLAEIQALQTELGSITSIVAQTESDMQKVQQSIIEINELIEQKKEQIIKLEDKVLARKDVMRERVVSMQQTESMSMIVEVLINAENFANLLERVEAVSTLLNADQDILHMQEEDLEQIEREKAAIKKKEEQLVAAKEDLARKQAELQAHLAAKQQALQAVQTKYAEINSSLTLASQEKASIEAGMKAIENELARQAEEQQRLQTATAAVQQITVASEESPAGGREMYVTATAYSTEESPKNEHITAAGYDIGANPNMKLIAVDPRVIKLGTKVWVEGYGYAVAGDTGGKILGYKIDVLMPSRAAALNWGVKRVKIIVFD